MRVFDAREAVAWIVAGAAACLGLVAYGFHEHPDASVLSVAAASAILISYGAVGLALRSLKWSPVLRPALIAGIMAGAVFAAEILLEYTIRPANNVIWGYVEFGAVFLIYALAAASAAWRGRLVSDAVRIAFVAAVIGSLIWCLVLLSVFYAFEGTSTQAAVLIAEGDPEDFFRSGMSDYRTFLIEDLFGATFFHLLVGPMIGAVLGLISSLSVATFKQLLGRVS